MAILQMKKLRLAAVRSNKDALLRELIRHGCVEFSEIEDEISESDMGKLFKREDTAFMSLKSDHATLTQAIKLLDRFAPVKGRLLSAPKEVEDTVLLDDSGVAAALKIADAIVEKDERIKRISAEESRQRSVIESLLPWQELDMPLDLEGTERSTVLLGSIPVRQDLDELNDALQTECEEAEVFLVSSDKVSKFVVAVCIKEALAKVSELLRSYGFVPSAVTGVKGTARKCISDANIRLRELAEEKTGCEKAIMAESVHRDDLKLAADRVNTKLALAQAEGKLFGTEAVVIMEGWMPAERESELIPVFEKFDCAWETSDPAEDEYPKVPVKLKNNRFTNALNMVTNMYSLPAYGTVDPNPLMAPFFILFFGLMMADIGYGIMMILAAVVALKKMKPRGNSKAFCQLLLYCGIATLAMGFLTGGLFSDIPYQIVHTLDPNSTWEGLWALFSPEKDSTAVLVGSLVLGLIHLNTGMAVSFVQKKKAGHLADGIFEEGSLWVILLGAVVMAAKLLGASETVYKIGLAVLVIGVAMLLFGAGRHSKGFGKVTAAFGCIYNTATGWFGDILSYSRIMALMLAGGVVGKVFNTVAVMPAQANGVNAATVIVFLVIFLLGHAMNFGLNLLGCYVHDLRLQCLEFFGKFYTDGGRAFDPLTISSEYVRAKE